MLQVIDGEAPQERNQRLMNAKQIAQEIFNRHVSPEWVRRNVPGKIRLGHSTVMWYERDVIDWIEGLREQPGRTGFVS